MQNQINFEKEIQVLDVISLRNGKKIIAKITGKPLEIMVQINFEAPSSVNDVVQFIVDGKTMDLIEFHDFIVEKISSISGMHIPEEVLATETDKEHLNKVLLLMDVFASKVPELALIAMNQRFNRQIQIRPETVRRVRVDFVNDIGLESFYTKTAFSAFISGKEFQLEYARHWDDRLYINENGVLVEDTIQKLIEHINQRPMEVAFTTEKEVFREYVVEKARKMIK